MKLFIDTNVFLRFFIPSDTEKHEFSKKLISSVEKGSLRAYTSSIVLLECYYVLTSFYKTPRNQVFEIFTRILGIRNLTIIEQSDTRRAIEQWEKTGVKYTDCLIATQVGEGIALCTYDREFRKLPHLQVVDPAEVLQKVV